MPQRNRLLRVFASISLALAAASTATVGAAAAQSQPPALTYVALGSSYASGPGIPPANPDAPPRCGQSINNYPHLLAPRRNLRLVDRSCAGATTHDVLYGGQWGLPAQLQAVTADTRLVTVTIGGNDVGFMGNLVCAASAPCQIEHWPSTTSWDQLAANLGKIAAAVHHQAPRARLVFVDYFTVLPEGESACPNVPISRTDLGRLRALAAHVAELTADAARTNDALLLRASALSASHNACSADPWLSGRVPDKDSPSAPFHPNAKGMAQIAVALDALLSAPGR